MATRRKKQDPDPARRDGAVVLTFVNQGSRRSPRLRDYAGLVDWADRYGVLAPSDTPRLRRIAADQPDDAAAVFATARELHEALSAIVNAAVDRRAPPSEAVERLNGLLLTVAPRRILVPSGTRLRWEWPEDPERDLYRPLWGVVLSASELLTSADVAKVKRCAAEDCDVLFLPSGRGMPRKWCDMRSCGDPARSRRYYRRVRKPENEAWKKKKKKARLLDSTSSSAAIR